MSLKEYFETTKGHGVLATADSSGRVDVAVYARPYFEEENLVAFIMADRLTHRNLQSNPQAAYLFLEQGAGYAGRRLYLTRTREESDDELIDEICRRCDYSIHKGKLTRYVVFFKVENVRPLVGSNT